MEDEATHPTGINSDDLSKGYAVYIYAHSDGTFTVSDPEQLDDTASSEDAVATLSDALKRAYNILKANPVGENEQAQFEAGYDEGPAGEAASSMPVAPGGVY